MNGWKVTSKEERSMNVMDETKLDRIDDLEIEPLSDEALELVAGGASSDGNMCCSCRHCTYTPPIKQL